MVVLEVVEVRQGIVLGQGDRSFRCSSVHEGNYTGLASEPNNGKCGVNYGFLLDVRAQRG